MKARVRQKEEKSLATATTTSKLSMHKKRVFGGIVDQAQVHSRGRARGPQAAWYGQCERMKRSPRWTCAPVGNDVVACSPEEQRAEERLHRRQKERVLETVAVGEPSVLVLVVRVYHIGDLRYTMMRPGKRARTTDRT